MMVGPILDNKYGIMDTAELAKVEEKNSKEKAMLLFESGDLSLIEVGTFKGLAEIHRRLFEDVYPFAGKLRTVNLSKGQFRFAPVLYLLPALQSIDKMPHGTFEEILAKYVEMNVAHPFREGNGRSTRIWLDAMLKQGIGKVVDWSMVNKEDYLLAMERSPVRDTEIKMLLQNALTDRINDREVYMKGIDASYHYEGYSAYLLLPAQKQSIADRMAEAKAEADRRNNDRSLETPAKKEPRR